MCCCTTKSYRHTMLGILDINAAIDSQVKREIIEGMNTPLSACLPEDKVDW